MCRIYEDSKKEKEIEDRVKGNFRGFGPQRPQNRNFRKYPGSYESNHQQQQDSTIYQSPKVPQVLEESLRENLLDSGAVLQLREAGTLC